MSITIDNLNDDIICVDQKVYERIKNNPDGVYIEAEGRPMLKMKVVGWEVIEPNIVDKKTCKYYKPYMDTLKTIIKEYYTLENCGSGGPLHVFLDDNNYDIHSVDFSIKCCMEYLREGSQDIPNDVYTIGIMIANEYAKMSLEERAVFDSYLCGHKLDCCDNCEECELLGETYEYMKEAEGAYNDQT